MPSDPAPPPARRLAAVLAALLVAATTATAAPASLPAALPGAADGKACCVDPYRRYTATPTAQVVALWAAAKALDEPAFMRLLPQVDRVADHAVGDVPLLAALLRRQGTDARQGDGDSPADTARVLESHRRKAPSLTRMVVAALQRGASTADVTLASPTPPLHLALLFGTPDAVRALLAAGARPDQREQRDRRTALEFMLDQEFAVRMSRMPPLVSRAERSDMVLQLLKADPSRPFRSLEKQLAKDGVTRPAADYLAWPHLVGLTEGGDVVRALAKTGTRPAIDVETTNEPTVLAIAAAAGNTGGLQAVLELVPEVAGAPGARDWNPQLDAALAAAATGHIDLARSLARKRMPFSQVGPRALDDSFIDFRRVEVRTGTLLHFAARAGDAAWIRQLVEWGAPVDGEPGSARPTPLREALSAHQADAAAMLVQLGADPLKAAGAAGRPRR